MAYPTIPVKMSSTGPGDVASYSESQNPLTGYESQDCAVAQCLSITKQLIFGRRHPVIAFPKQSEIG